MDNFAVVKAFLSSDGKEYCTFDVPYKSLSTIHQDVSRFIVKQGKMYLKTYYGYLIEYK
jgi:hypothetical protein